MVLGAIAATDADGDALTYSAPASTDKGTCVALGADGSFTTPRPPRPGTPRPR